MNPETEEGVLDEPVLDPAEVVEEQTTGDPADDDPGTDTATGETEPEAEVVVQIGDEKPEEEERAPSWIKELRQRNRDLAAENRALKSQQTVGTALGPKPTLEDFEFDSPKYEAALTDWMSRKQAFDARQADVERQTLAAQQAWNTKLAAYGTAKVALNVPDFDNAEAVVLETLSEQQQAIIVKGAKNPALVVLALGKNPKKAKELAGIADPVEFAFAVATVETQLKVTKRTPPAPNDAPVTNTAPRTGSEATLDKLRTEAAKTGDYSKVVEYRRKQKQT